MKKMKFYKNYVLIEIFDLINQEPSKEGFWIFSSKHNKGGLFLDKFDLIEKQDDIGFILYKNQNIYKVEFS